MPFKNHRPAFPVVVTVLIAGLYAWVNSLPEFDYNFLAWANSALGLLLVLLLLIWFLLLGRFSGRTRLLGLGLIVLLGLGFRLCLRVDGAVSGTGLPRYRWAWTPPEQRHFKTDQAPPAAAPTAVAEADVPQFLGPDRNGIIAPVPFSIDWQKSPPKQLWRQDIGEGWGAFCVIGSRAITQEQRGDEEWVSCYDLGTGAMLWHHADKTRFSEWQGGDGPRATPTHHDGKLYSIGGTGWLNCLELATGKVLWSHNVLMEHKGNNLKWGVSGSPLIHEGMVIVTGGDLPGPTLLAYDANTGALRWKSGTAAATYGSPILATLCGRTVIVTSDAPGLTLRDPATGTEVFHHPWGSDKFPKGSQPIVLPEDKVFLSAGYGMGCSMLQLKADAAGKITANELWQHNKMKNQFNSCTPVNGHLYGLDDGKLACLDIATGERLFKEGRYGAGQHLLLTGTDRKLTALVQSEPGAVYLVSLDSTGTKELSKLEALTTKTWNYPTLADRHLLLRNDRQVVCYELAK